ncbi:hypothetical protein C0Q70_12498 [Pomacea canaliculata]|uniref:BTB domain-containing protein n=1 Tax=Pomacea canaliculata TaxID=400727 RepID=A0A2T7P1N8_POMCA|nr:hypothetical protein C0Q70_12498 [Pomacea canaliculata]
MASGKFRDAVFANTFHGLGQLREAGQFCDLHVTVRDQDFYCHRVVLASVSQFFKSRLASTPEEGFTAHVQVDHEDVSPQFFSSLLDFVYKGKDFVTQNTAKDILKMSAYFQMDFLTNHCEEFILRNIRPKVCLGVWQFAQKYKLHRLASKAYKMAVDSIDRVSHDELLALPKSMLLILLSLQRKLSMDNTCKLITDWVAADQDKRAVHLTEFLPFISFPHLSSSYLSELMISQSNEMRNVFFGIRGRDSNSQQRILAQQSVKVNLPEIQSRAVLLGGVTRTGHSLQRILAFGLQDTILTHRDLEPIPEATGPHFASCTWRNEVYLSGGTLMPKFFAVYKPRDNQWQVLPDLTGQGLEKHPMAAVNSCIYVLGGMEKRTTGEKRTSPQVSMYNVSTSTWSDVCQLSTGVREASAAVIGHRVYVFGGTDSREENTDLVQCVDTLTGRGYVAGRLPSATCGSRALSNGGIIYVVLTTGEVLQMWEDFDMAEQAEHLLATGRDIGTEDKSTVSFKQVAQVSARYQFGACLHDGEIILCGGHTDTGDPLSSVERINTTGHIISRRTTLTSGATNFDLHVLNVPQIRLTKRLLGSSEVIVDFPNLKGWRCRADALEPCLAVGYKCDTK